MDYNDRPPDPDQEDFEKFELDKIPFDIEGDSAFPLRKARVSDLKGIMRLVNGFAASNLMLARGPQYIYENIRDFVVAEDENTGESPQMIACASLHVLWDDMAEIRATAIHPDYQGKGLGRRLVEYMKIEGKELGIKTLFTWTLAEKFFAELGFKRKGKEELPSKVWGECNRCPKYFNCDEIGMVMEL
ncbi:MAG: N-acetyltransferase [Deltaproteobacteria bacterium]|nr:N-acetyltransferase [Deltaproteobacteria bacterium]